MAFEGISAKLQGVFKKLTGRGKLSEKDVRDAMREIRLALLEADVNFLVVKDFVKTVTDRAVGAEVLESLTPGQQVIKIVNEELTKLMGGGSARLEFGSVKPAVFLMAGLQGAGKTTMCGKLALMLKKQYGKTPMLAACDIYRPAAIDQLRIVGAQAGVPVFERGQADPVETARLAVEKARHDFCDVLIIDTAGRLHIDADMMDELGRIRNAVNPSEVLLVVDAMTGQDAVNVARTFNETVELSGVVLTKLDGDTRGGAALSVRAVTGKPIKLAVRPAAPFAADAGPAALLIVGVNGVGKTTSIGKIAHCYREQGRRPMLAAGDTFRAAAAEQLGEWARRADVPMVRHGEGADPSAVVFDAIASGRAKGCDLLICDTAGRLHNRSNLMNELAKMRRVIGRELPDVPCETLLVLDATTGQNAVAQARGFAEAAGLTGVILTKLDGTAKGGVVVAVADALGLPVRFVGVGEQIDDLRPFDPDAFAAALF